MAKKKKENTLQYLQMPLPESARYSKMTKRSWSGLNYRQKIDTGALSMENNISTIEAPYLVPSQRIIPQWWSDTANPDAVIGLFGVDDILIVIYREQTNIKISYVKDKNTSHTGVLKTDAKQDGSDDYPRCIVQFNVYDTPTDPITGKYVKKLLIYPDCKSMDFDISKDFTISDMNAEIEVYTEDEEPYLPPSTADKEKYQKNTYNQDVYRWVEDEEGNGAWKISVPPGGPKLKYATVHLSRVFGVDDDRVYASGYNDYTNWNLDTVGEYNESNSWCSPAQSNTKANSSFTGITTFQNHVICFKENFMHEIYNNKNPFRIQDIFAEGAVDNRTIQDVDGRLIFVSSDGVKIYTGSNPRNIGYFLGIDRFKNPVSGTDGRNYYLYCEDENNNKRLLVYDTYVEQWSERKIESAVISFAHNKNGMYMLCADNEVYKLDTGDFGTESEKHYWSFETDLITNQTVNIKHIKKIQMFANIGENANIKAYILYDDEKFNEKSHLVYDSKDRTGQLPIRVKPRQTANYGFKLHFEGNGYVRLYELEIFVEAGGDLYV
jgi:hypothetical protein